MLNLLALQQLSNKKIDVLDFETMVAFTIHQPRSFVLAHPEFKPSPSQIKKISALVKRRATGEPLAYLLNHKEFFGLDFLVDKRVLVPRPETEILVEETVDIISKIKYQKSKIALIDVGTGSGCIPISVISAMGGSAFGGKTFATDISKSALVVAKKNAKKHGVQIKFLQGNLLSPFIKHLTPNTSHLTPHHIVITANLPYGWKEWKNNCSLETRGLKFEPQNALFTGKQGLQLYEELFQQVNSLSKNLKPQNITLLCEFDPRQTKIFTKLTKKYFPTADFYIKKDLAGRDRVLVINQKFKSIPTQGRNPNFMSGQIPNTGCHPERR